MVDQLSRRGYRFFGPVTVHVGDAVFEDAIRRVHSVEQPYPVAAVILLALERVAALVSPGSWRVADEQAMRVLWRERRTALDEEFEAYLAQVEPFRVSR